MEEPNIVDAGVDGEGFFTKGVVVDEVSLGGCLPAVCVGKELAVESFVGDEVPVEEGGIIPISISVEGESPERLVVSVLKSRGDLHLPVLQHAQ